MADVGATLDDPPPCAVRMIAPVIAQPIQVSILSCSPEKADLAHHCHIPNASIQCGEVRPIDYRRWYEDITSNVGEKCGKSHDLHRTIIGSPDFVSAMKTCVDLSVKGPRLQIRVHPTYGSYVLAMIEADALNELRTPDDRRVFNARVYCLHEKTETECRTTIAEALSWLDDDGSRLEGAGDRDGRFGYAATLVDPNLKQYDRQNMQALIAQRNWDEWHDTLTTYEISITGTSKIVVDNKVIEQIMAAHVTVPPLSDDDAPSLNDDQDEELPVAELIPTQSCASADVRQTLGYVPPGPWPTRDANSSSMQQWRSAHRQEPSWNKWTQGGTQTSWWYTDDGQPEGRDGGRGTSWQPGDGSSNTRPSHVTAHDSNDRARTIESWYDELNYDLDQDAMKQMLLLAQHSDKGYEAVNSLIDKLFLKKRKGEVIENHSAFICKGVRKAREAIDPWQGKW